MDALVMCGGRGTRLDADVEKPLFAVGGEPMVDRVVTALAGARTDGSAGVDRTYAAVSPNAPATGDHLRNRDGVTVVETPGEGYVTDLGVALDAVEGGEPVLTAVADLPLLAPGPVESVLRAWRRATGGDDHSLTVRVPLALKARLGASVDDRVVFEDGGDAYLPAGVNVVGRSDRAGGEESENEVTEHVHTTYDARLAVNVNRLSDRDVAEALLCD